MGPRITSKTRSHHMPATTASCQELHGWLQWGRGGREQHSRSLDSINSFLQWFGGLCPNGTLHTAIPHVITYSIGMADSDMLYTVGIHVRLRCSNIAMSEWLHYIAIRLKTWDHCTMSRSRVGLQQRMALALEPLIEAINPSRPPLTLPVQHTAPRSLQTHPHLTNDHVVNSTLHPPNALSNHYRRLQTLSITLS